MKTLTTPAARSLVPGQAIQVSTVVTGGPPQGGQFTTDATGTGTFTTGANTRSQASGSAISGNSRNVRSWTYGYNAPTTPGHVMMYTVGMATDANGSRDQNDRWSFHGFDQTATLSTPIHLFVNAVGVTPLGSGCPGSYDNVPVFGSSDTPSVGNGNFAYQVHGAAPSSQLVLLIGSQPGVKIDLTPIGISGCTLYVQSLLELPGATSAGNAQRSQGSATVKMPIPNNQSLRGATIQAQVAILDLANGRRLPVTMTNALSVKIQ